ncbi:MAG TPA: methylenetetrahydrofolate reductase [NAD(P)H], partial [Acidiferrobacteraceae bacterium]|nr:methylenetetrahydrofolate reductase [NAD(P)H] [Acidiferrobacteraceae bacterium]
MDGGAAGKVFSFEFFPPKTEEATERLRQTAAQLAQLRPRFCSVTFGAGGSTRDRTYSMVRELQEGGQVAAAPHLSCIGASRESLREILSAYQALGVRHLVALRGDLPSGMGDPGEFRHASDLVRFIRTETGNHFHIDVATYPEGHPASRTLAQDVDALKQKVLEGANSAITQYFFNPDAYFRFTEDCMAAGIDIPIVPGIMPVTNYAQLARFSDLCGAEIPRWLRRRLQDYQHDPEALRAFGLDVTTELCA